MKRFWVWVFLTVLLAVHGCSGCRKKKDKKEAIEAKVEIEGHVLRGDYVKAQKAAEDYLKGGGKAFQDAALFYSAFCLQYHSKNPQPSQAVSRYQELLREHPKSILREEALFQLGQCFQGDPLWPNPEHAIIWYQQLLAEFPDGHRADRALYEKGLCHESVLDEESELKEALSCYQKLADKKNGEPWSTRALYRRARIKERMGDLMGAARDYELLLQMEDGRLSAEKRAGIQMRLASLLTNSLRRPGDGQQILSALMAETKNQDWKAAAQQVTQRKGASR